MSVDKQVIGNCTLYCADCYAILDTLVFSCIVTDPPYGLKCVQHKNYKKEFSDMMKRWDNIVNLKPFLLRKVPSIIFGGNYYTDQLPPSRKWILWDKGGHFIENLFLNAN